MKKLFIVGCLLQVAFTSGFALLAQNKVVAVEPESTVLLLCKEKKYHAAMLELPKAMEAWEKYTELTGSTSEGAAGYLFSTTMNCIASKGDADWGKILDDPDIPYNYKTDLIFEILELRLGKGAIYVGNRSNFIMPRNRRIDLNKEMIKIED